MARIKDIFEKILNEPMNIKHYEEIFDELRKGKVSLGEIFEVLNMVTDQFLESSQFFEFIKILEGIYESKIRGKLGREVEARFAEGIGDLVKEILKNEDKALVYYEEAVELFPLESAYSKVLDYYFDRDNHEEAVKVADEAISKLGFENLGASFLKKAGDIYFNHDNYYMARECFLHSLEKNGDDGEVKDSLDVINEVIDDRKKSLEQLKAELKEVSGEDEIEILRQIFEIAFSIDPFSSEGVDALLSYLSKTVDLDAFLFGIPKLKKSKRWKELSELYLKYLNEVIDKEKKFLFYKDLGDIYFEHLKNKKTAAEYYKKALLIKPAHREIIERLDTIYKEARDFNELKNIYANALKYVKEINDEMFFLTKLAELYHKFLKDDREAEKIYRKIRSINPKNIDALKFYESYYLAKNDFNRFFTIFLTRLEILPDDELEEAGFEGEKIITEKFNKKDEIIEIWKRVCERRFDNERVVNHYINLLEENQRWVNLVQFLKNLLKYIPDDNVEKKQEILLKLAEIYDDPNKLNIEEMAISTYKSILEINPQNREVLEILEKKFRARDDNRELTFVLLKKADLETDVQKKKEILNEVYKITQSKVGDTEIARQTLEKLYELDPENKGIIERLKSIYARRREYAARFVELSLKELDQIDDPVEKKKNLITLAKTIKRTSGDIEQTTRLLEMAFKIDPSDLLVQRELSSIYLKSNNYEKYASFMEILIENTDDEVKRINLLSKLGKIYLKELKDYGKAEKVYLTLQSIRPNMVLARNSLEKVYIHTANFEKLKKLYEETGNWTRYVSTLEENLQNIETPEVQLKVLEEIAETCRTKLKDSKRELQALLKGVEIDPLNLNILRKLRSIYEKEKEQEKLILVYSNILSVSDDPDERYDCIKGIVEISRELNTISEHLNTFYNNLDVVVAKRDEQFVRSVYDAVKGSAAEVTFFEKLIDFATKAEKDEDKIFVYFILADIYFKIKEDYEKSEEFLKKILEIDRNNVEAILKLTEIYESTGDVSKLKEILEKTLEIEEDKNKRVKLLLKLGNIAEEIDLKPELAENYYRQAFFEIPGNEEAFFALEKLYQEQGDYEKLAELYSDMIEFVDTPERKAELKFVLAGIFLENLNLTEDAVKLYIDILNEGTGYSDEALMRIEEIFESGMEKEISFEFLKNYYEEKGDFEKCLNILELKHKFSGENELLLRLSEISESKLGNYEKAFDFLLSYLKSAEDIEPYLDKLEFLASKTDRWSEVFNFYGSKVNFFGEEEGEGETVDDLLKVKILERMAKIAEEKLDDLRLALTIYKKIIELEPDELAVIDKLIEITEKLEEYEEQLQFLKIKLEQTWEVENKKSILKKIVSLLLEKLGRSMDAVLYLRQYLELEPRNMEVVKTLHRLYEEGENYQELIQLIREHELPFVKSPEEKNKMLIEIAYLYRAKLKDYEQAFAIYRKLIDSGVTDSEVFDGIEIIIEECDDPDLKLNIVNILQAAYEKEGMWGNLVSVCNKKLELLESEYDRSEVFFKLGEILENRLGNPKEAYAYYLTSLELYPTEEKIDFVWEKTEENDTYDDFAVTLESILENDSYHNPVRLYKLLGKIYKEHLNMPKEAVKYYKKVYEEEPGLIEILPVLEELYEKLEDYENLIRVKETLAENSTDPVKQCEYYLEIAKILIHMGKEDKSEEFLLRIMDSPLDDDNEILTESFALLNDYYRSKEDYDSLVEIIENRIFRTKDPELKKSLYFELVDIFDEYKKDPDRVIEILNEILLLDPEDTVAIEKLQKAYEENERWEEYEQFLLGLLSKKEGEDRILILKKLGNYYLFNSIKNVEAYEVFTEILKIDPDDKDAVLSLVSLLDREDIRLMTFEFLVNHLKYSTDFELLYSIYKTAITQFPDELPDKKKVFLKFAEICFEELAKYDEAFEALTNLYKEMPDDEEVYERLLDYSEKLERIEELIDTLDEIAASQSVPEDIVKIYEKKANLYLEKLHDPLAASEIYESILEIEPANLKAINKLISIYESQENWEKVLPHLEKKVELVDDVSEKVRLLKKIAWIYINQFKDYESAILMYEEVLSYDDKDEESYDAIFKLKKAQNQVDESYEILERKLEKFKGTEKEKEIKIEILNFIRNFEDYRDVAKQVAIDLLEKYGEIKDACDFLEGLIKQGEDVEFLVSVLESILKSSGNFEKLAEIFEEGIKHLDDTYIKNIYVSKLKEIYRDKLGNSYLALQKIFELIKANPVNLKLYDEAYRLAEESGSFGELAEFYTEILGDITEDKIYVKLASTIGDIFREKLNQPYPASNFYKIALERAFDNEEIFKKLESVYKEIGEVSSLALLYEEKAVNSSSYGEKIKYYEKVYDIYKNQLNDRDQARAIIRQIIEQRPQDRKFYEEGIRLFEEIGDYRAVREIYEAYLEVVDEVDERAKIREKLARVLIYELEEYGDGISLLEENLIEAGRREESFEILESILNIDIHPREKRNKIYKDVILILENFYEVDKDAEKLVFIYEVKANLVDDRYEKIELFERMGTICQENLNDDERAIGYFIKALNLDPTAHEIHDRIVALIEKTGNYEMLAGIYQDILDNEEDDEVLNTYLYRLGNLYKDKLQDKENAAAIFEIYRKRKPEDREVLTFLEEYYKEKEDYKKLADILESLIKITDERDEKGVLLLELGEILESKYENPEKAVFVYENYLEIEPDNIDVFKKLESLYISGKAFEKLVKLYENFLSFAGTPEEKIEILKKCAQIYETVFNNLERAKELLQEVLLIDKNNLYALNTLERIYTEEKEYDDLYAVLSKLKEIYKDDREKSILYDLKMGNLKLRKMDDPRGAFVHYKNILKVDEKNEDALDFLEELLEFEDIRWEVFDFLENYYKKHENYNALIQIYTYMFENSDDRVKKAEISFKTAKIFEEKSKDIENAVLFYRYAVSNSPETEEYVNAFIECGKKDPELLFDSGVVLLDEIEDPVLARNIGLKIVYALKEEGYDEAKLGEIYKILIDKGDESYEILEPYCEILEKNARIDEALNIWEKLSQALEPEINQKYRFKMGAYLISQDGDKAEEGAGILVELLSEGYKQDEIASLILENIDRLESPVYYIEVVESYYKNAEKYQNLVDALIIKLGYEDSLAMQSEINREIGMIYIEKLNNLEEGYSYLTNACLQNPDLLFLLPKIKEIAYELENFEEFASFLETLVEGGEIDDELKLREILDTLYDIYKNRLNDLTNAERIIEKIYSLFPNETGIIEELLEFYEETGNIKSFIEVGWKKIENTFDDEENEKLLRKIIEKAEIRKDIDAKIRAYEHLLEMGRLKGNEIDILKDLYEQKGDSHKAIRIIERSIENETDPEKIIENNLKLARLKMEQGFDPKSTVSTLEKVLEFDPTNIEALYMLASIYREENLYEQLRETLEQILNFVEDKEEKLSIYYELYELNKEEFKNYDKAVFYLNLISEIDSENEGVIDNLIEIYSKNEDYENLEKVLNKKLKFESSVSSQYEILTRIAWINYFKHGNTEKAKEILDNILKGDPYFIPAMRLSLEIAKSEGDVDECLRISDEMLKLKISADERVKLLKLQGEMYFEKGDLKSAKDRYLKLHNENPEDIEVIDKLIEIYEKIGSYDALVAMLEKKLKFVESPKEKALLKLKIAKIYRNSLSDDENFVKWINDAYETFRESEEIVTEIIDYYREKDEPEKYLPYLEWYVNYLEMQKKDREKLAKYISELAETFELMGDDEKALMYRKLCKKYNPKDYKNLIKLGMLYYDTGDYDNALKTFQTLILKQHAIKDLDDKVTIYMHLARILAQQGNYKKAIQYTNRILALDPDNELAKEFKEELSKY